MQKNKRFRFGELFMYQKKMWCIMRLACILILAFNLSVAAAAFSQSKVSLELKDATMEEFIAAMKEQTGTQFLYNSSLLKVSELITVNVKDEDFRAVLDKVLSPLRLTYNVVNDVVVIKRLPYVAPDKTWKLKGKVTDQAGEALPGVTVRLKGTTIGISTDIDGAFTMEMKKDVDTLVVSFIGMKTQFVPVKREKTEYVIKLEEDVQEMDEVVVVSTGYQDIDRRRLTSAVTTLKMDDIKVAGIASIDKMLEGHVPGMIFMQNSGQAGAAARVRIRGTSTVLGNQEPLWVLDGVVLADPVNVDPSQLNDLDFVNLLGNAISGLNPDDIEQIDVLKDAAATAIYGTRAANGVIVITTKKGKVGPPSVTYSISGTLNRRPYYSDREINLMNSQERIDVSREMFHRGMEFKNVSNWVGYEAAYLDYKAGILSFDQFQEKANYYERVNTDWFDILCENSFSNKHTLSVTGGSPNIRYYASVGYNDERGVIKKEKNQTYTANLKLNGNFEKVDFQFGIIGNVNERRYTPTSVTQYAYEMSRAIPAYNPDGSRWFYMIGSTRDLSYPFNIENEMETTYQTMNTHSVTFTGNLKYRVLPYLNVEGTASYTFGRNTQETVYEEDSWYVAKLRKKGSDDTSSECPLGGELKESSTDSRNWLVRLQFNYNQMFKDIHQLNVALGGEMSSKRYNSYAATHRGYYPERGKTFASIDGTFLYKYGQYRDWMAKNKPSISETLTNLTSAYLAITYTYDNRYTLNFNTRIDGSNQFGSRSNEKLLPIWSISGRWDVKEDLLKNSNAVNRLALKFSYGHQGNMLDNQTSKMIIEKGDLNSWYNEFSSTIKYYPNPDLKWELTSSYNIDLEFSLWKDKISGSIGYYYKHTKDAFLSKSVSEINGVSSYVVNKGEISNQGVEVSLSFTPINQKVDASGKRGFVWRFDPQIGQVVNSLISKAINNKDRTVQDKIKFSDYLRGSVELKGKPLQTFYSYRFKGLSSVDGRPIFYGTEEEQADALYEKYCNMTDEEVWDAVLVESGTRVPTLQGGINNYFGYRQFGLSMNFAYSFGNKVRLLKLCEENNITPYPERNMRKEFVNRWQRPGDENKTNIPGVKVSEALTLPWWGQSKYTSNGKMTKFADNDIYAMYDLSDLRVVSGNYLKLQSVTFRYNVHDKFCKKLGINSAYLSLTGTNLFTITNKKLKGQDVTQSGAAPTINMSLRPNYSFTLNVTF